jgi:hypothetical protein
MIIIAATQYKKGAVIFVSCILKTSHEEKIVQNVRTVFSISPGKKTLANIYFGL